MTDTRLFHWSKDPVQLAAKSYTQKIAYKPCGLWFDADGDWKRWCDGEAFNPDGFAYCYEVTIRQMERVHWMRNERELDRFTSRFLAPIYPGQELHPRSAGINWPRVAEEYDGIVIVPYVGSRRMSLMWYYTFDCASGCVWNTDIVSLETVSSAQLIRLHRM